MSFVTLERDLDDLQAQLKAAGELDAAFRQGIAERIARLEERLAELEIGLASHERRLGPLAKSAYRDLTLRMVRVFAFTWVAASIALVLGLGGFPDLTFQSAAAWAALVGMIAAVAKAVQAAFTADEAPFLGRGVGRSAT